MANFDHLAACWESCPEERRSPVGWLGDQGLIGVYGKPQIRVFLESKHPTVGIFGGLRELKRPALGPGATYITGIGLDTAEMQGFLKSGIRITAREAKPRKRENPSTKSRSATTSSSTNTKYVALKSEREIQRCVTTGTVRHRVYRTGTRSENAAHAYRRRTSRASCLSNRHRGILRPTQANAC